MAQAVAAAAVSVSPSQLRSTCSGRVHTPCRSVQPRRVVVRASVEAAVESSSSSSDGSGWEQGLRRQDFSILQQQVHGQPLVYLDNAATSHKPDQVLQAHRDFYNEYNSNVHRGVHTLSSLATDAYEAARSKVARFVNAASDQEIVWTRNASEAINLVAQSWGMNFLKEGDEVVLSVSEHHSNLVPWQLVAEKTGAKLR